MKNSFSRGVVLVSFACLALPASADSAKTAASTNTPAPKKTNSYFFSSLLPRAFQSHPLLALSVITEMTDEGKKLPLPTAEEPMYYFCDYRYHEEGNAPLEKTKVAMDNLQKLVQNALATNHYLKGDKDHPAALVLFFLWGVHAKLSGPDLETGEEAHEDIGHRNLLSRAALVGGTPFAKDLEQALKDKDRSLAGGPLIFDPVYRFSMKSDLNRNLLEQVLDDCYYVVVSAYDGAAIARGERKLLWRTKISTPAQGVSLLETLPALVASGTPFFGRPMAGPVIVDKRIDRNGSVSTGELKVLEMDGQPTEKPAEKK
ncbi:MAG: hypothetical protein QM790_14160 [Nibricoccus sp.]